MTFFMKAMPALALMSIACSAFAADSDLSKRIAQQDGWIGYQVPIVADAGTPCCFEWHGKNPAHSACELEGRNWSIGISDEHPMQRSDKLNVYLRVTHGQIEKVRAFGDTCALKDADRVHWLADVSSVDSVALLARAAAVASTEDTADAELTAMALHEDVSATAALAQLADSTHRQKLREQAVFWLGQARGAPGAQIVEHAATTDPDPEFRANAVFALSQSHGIDAYATILRIAQSDASDHVREQALFWMAQTQDARAQKDIIAAIEKDPSEKVREQGVFALSQLKDHEADAALIALVRGHYPRKVKEQALFWLGESGSNEALKFLDEILSKQPAQAVKS
jgi:HEAT repeat protein